MSEQNTPQDETELATLRKVNAELLSTKHTLKAEVTRLTEKADKAEAKLRTVVIDKPLKQLSEEISVAPSIWLREFLTDYKVDAADDGSLALLDKDGKPVALEADKPLNVSLIDLRRLLLSPNKLLTAERQKEYGAIMTVSRASGGAGSGKLSLQQIELGDGKKPKPVAPSFGLR